MMCIISRRDDGDEDDDDDDNNNKNVFCVCTQLSESSSIHNFTIKCDGDMRDREYMKEKQKNM